MVAGRMKSVTETSARRTIGAGLTEAKRRRRWPRALLWVVFIALVADVIGFMVYVSRYQPLAEGGPAGIDERQVAQEVHATSPGGRAFSQYRVDDLHGDHLWFSFTLVNSGRLPVTITSVGRSDPVDSGALVQTGVRIGPDDPASPPTAEATTFEPFSLDAGGGARLVVIDSRFAQCDPHAIGARTMYYGTVPVSYEVLGFYGRSTTVTLPFTIEVPPNAACGTKGSGNRQPS
jgi:hypothetical protein